MITLITCFRNLSETPHFTHSRWNIDMFRPFADTGLRCIICLPQTIDAPEWMNMPNIQIVRMDENAKVNSNIKTPESGNPEKDTPEYIAWTYDKPRNYLAAIDADNTGTTQYLCLDYDAASWLLKRNEPSAEAFNAFVHWMSAGVGGNRGLCIPGGWDKYTEQTAKTVASQICWRFCNGCIFADKETLKEWCIVHQALIQGFKQVYCNNVLPWDVNYVAWLEYMNLGPKITWYRASHDESMIENIPPEMFISPIPKTRIRERTQFNQYPEWPKHYPSSISVCEINGVWWMMTRYVNYWMYPNGMYHFYDSDQKIRTRNLLSRMCPETRQPILAESWFIADEVIGPDGEPLHVYPDKISFGIEDVRIYPGEGGQMRFVGTTMGFSPEGSARIVSGVVDIEKRQFVDAEIHKSNEWCEKNWVPVPGTSSAFIYKWSREGIVLRNADGTNTTIPVSPEYSNIIRQFRGSTILMPLLENQNQYKCVVHWSKDGSPRTYYHAIVHLDKNLSILNISPAFMFEGSGIEFCIGYIPGEKEDCFWVSRFDRDPFMVVVK